VHDKDTEQIKKKMQILNIVFSMEHLRTSLLEGTQLGCHRIIASARTIIYRHIDNVAERLVVLENLLLKFTQFLR